MKLYYSPGACSLASHIALEEWGGDYETVKVDLGQHKTEDGTDFYTISPRGYVPAISDNGMDLLTENPAVLTYIAQKTGTLPDGVDFFRLLEWIGFIGTEIHGGYGPLFGQAGEEQQAKAKDGLAKTYRLTEDLMDGKDWLVGNGPTVADNYLFVTLLWADDFGIDLPQSLIDYRERNKQRDAVAKAMKSEGLIKA